MSEALFSDKIFTLKADDIIDNFDIGTVYMPDTIHIFTFLYFFNFNNLFLSF